MFDGPTTERLTIDPSVYSLDAVMRTCYWFTDRCWIFIEKNENGFFVVSLEGKKPDADLRALAGEFANGLLDHQLRVNINAETQVVRSLIVGKAFAEGMLEDPPPGHYGDPVATGHSWDELAPLRHE